VTAEIVNLRRARKAKARAAQAESAATNRVRFGRTRAERERLDGQARIEASWLDGHRLTPDAPDSDKP
jgi:hypothetical protein